MPNNEESGLCSLLSQFTQVCGYKRSGCSFLSRNGIGLDGRGRNGMKQECTGGQFLTICNVGPRNCTINFRMVGNNPKTICFGELLLPCLRPSAQIPPQPPPNTLNPCPHLLAYLPWERNIIIAD